MSSAECEGGNDVSNPRYEGTLVEAFEKPVEEESPQAEDKSTKQHFFTNAGAERGKDGDRKFGMRESAEVIDGREGKVADDEDHTADQPKQKRNQEPTLPITIFTED